MKQSLKHKQRFSLNLTLNLQKQIELLSQSGFEIRSNLDDLISEFCKESNNKKINYFRDEVIIDRFRHSINPDLQRNTLEFSIDQENDLREKLLEH